MDGTGIKNNIDQRIIRSNQAFKDALSVLCNEKEITDITITDIVTRASYSRKTFYAHYASKADFLISIVDEEVRHYIDELCRFYPMNKNMTYSKADDSSMQSRLKLFQHIYDNRELYKLILGEKLFQQSTDYFCEKAFSEYYNRIRKKTSLYMTKPFDFDYSSIDNNLFFYTRIYKLLVFVKYWIKQNFKYSPQYMAEQELYLRSNIVIYSKE